MAVDDDYPSQDELTDLQDLLESISSVDDDELEKVMKAAALSRERYDELREMYQKKKLREQPVEQPYPPYPDYRGTIPIGTDPDGRPVAVTRCHVNEHVLVVGRTGAGKTTFFQHLMGLFNDRGVPFLAFDFKNDYRAVADALDLVVVNWRDLKFNPLQPPPGVSTAKWAEVLADTWTYAMGLLNASRNYFLRKLRQLYGLYEEEIEDAGRYPSLFELRDLVRVDEIPYASPRYRYKERVDNRTSGMLAFSGAIFDCSRGYPIEKLLDRNVVLELQEPNQDV